MNISRIAAINGQSRHPICALTADSIGWSTIGLVTMADMIGLHQTGFHVVFGAASNTILPMMAIMLVIVWTNLRAKAPGAATTLWTTRLQNLAFTGRWIIALGAFCTVTSIASHLSVAVAAPLIDDRLIEIDRAVGFDWLACYQWVRHHPALLLAFNIAYGSGIVQMIVVPLILGVTGRRVDLVHHMARLIIATLICLTIATAFPAASTFLHYHITDPGTSDTVSMFFPLRDGVLRTIDLSAAQGLVSTPSMHTSLAILFAYALRRVPVVGRGAIALNGLMIVSTPTQGGHYLCDIAAGIALAFAAIAMVSRFSQIKRNP